MLFQAMTPIAFGIVLAYILNILMAFYERHYFHMKAKEKNIVRSCRPVCLTASFLTLFLILVCLISCFVGMQIFHFPYASMIGALI